MEVSKMSFRIALIIVITLAFFASGAQAAPQETMSPAADPLGTGTWEQIVSTEHTAEYLAKTGGMAQPTDYGAIPSINVAGNWTFELRDLKSRPLGDVDLRLYQAGSVVFGTGTFKSGLESKHVTADGYLAEGSAMVLGVVSYEDANLYRLSINDVQSSATSGTFTAFAPSGGQPLQGTIYGGKNEPRTFSSFGT
jgi:hypothetical protein